MANIGPYSELEYLILALVGEGSNSGYAMRKEMMRMRGGRWSAESGSVYRVLRRLERDGLLAEMRKVGVPNRERTEYDLTERGEALLNAWLTYPPDRTELSFLVDPVRTRSYFLSRLTPTEQLKVVKQWMQSNKAFIVDLEAELERTAFKEPFRNLAYHNLVYLAEGRQEWLRHLYQHLKDTPAEAKPLRAQAGS